MTRREFLRTLGLAGASLMLAGCGRRVRAVPSAKSLNVLLIVADTLRADHLGCYGSPLSLTPNLDALAARGTLFANALSCSPSTGPAHESLMTGTYQTKHGVMLNEGDMEFDFVTLAQALWEAGYATAAFVSNPVLAHDTELHMERGFDEYDDEMPSLAMTENRAYRAAPDSIAAALKWLKEKRERPFFLWLHLMEPHGPYEVPDAALLQKVGKLAPWPEDPQRLDVLKDNGGLGGIPKYQVLREERVPAHYRACYAARVAYLDRHIGHLMEQLHERGLDKNTLLVFISDHGELLGERGYFFQHGITTMRPVLQIPLILQGPDIPQKQTRAEVVSIVDIMPTILECTALGPRGLKTQLQGQSLTSLIRGKSEDKPKARFAFSQNFHERALLLGTHKYTIADEELDFSRLTNLQTDPREVTDLSAKEPKLAKELQAQLDSVVSQAPELFAHGKKNKRVLSEEDKQRLRSLGYL